MFLCFQCDFVYLYKLSWCSLFSVSAWTTSHKQTHLGVPRFIGTGSFESSGTKYRFMIMDRFGQDVEKLFLESRNKFPLHTIFGLGLRIVSRELICSLLLLNCCFLYWHKGNNELSKAELVLALCC